MPRTNYTMTRARAVVDESSIERTNGATVDWSRVTAGADGKKKLVAGQLVGRTAIGEIVPRTFSATLTSAVVAANIATITLVGHGFKVGETVVISGASLAYVNGTKTVLTVADANTFTVDAAGANATATGTILAGYAAQGIIETDANQDAYAEACSGYSVMVGGVLYESLLPDATGTPKVLSAAAKVELSASGCTFKFRPYSDSRAN